MDRDQHIHIIAEAGTNHNGKLEQAVELVDVAVRARADSVKFQIIYPWGLYLPGEYQYGHYDIKEVIRIRQEGMLEDGEYRELAAYCREAGIPFTASVFDTRGLDLLMEFDPPFIKTASCDLNNTRFLREVAARGKRMVISTGMSTFQDIEKSLNALARDGFDDVVLLHCVSIYPASLRQTNLGAISELKKTFGFPVGFSDHTGTSHAACMALAKGATWFEKHYTIDKSLPGFDHAYAQEPDEFAAYVQDLHDAMEALKPKAEKISPEERYTRKRARRSLYAARDLRAGTVIRNEDVLIVRPENKMDADQIDLLIGKTLKRDLEQYSPFSLEIIQ